LARDTSPYVVGDHWLDQRRDGKASGIWQIGAKSSDGRSVVYQSTRTRDLEAAKAAIHAFVETNRAMGLQSSEDAEVLPHLFLYWKEHGRHTRNPDTIAGSLRAFIGFLLQDPVRARVRFSELTRTVFRRFVNWRMKPHSFTVDWLGREMTLVSRGVKGESAQRNIDDVRAALNHAVEMERVPSAPKVPSVAKEHRSPPRDVRMSLDELGAIAGYASQVSADTDDKGFGRWLWLMIGTACRPEAALAFDPLVQWKDGLVDTHPEGAPRTKKHNPVVGAPPALAKMLDDWRKQSLAARKNNPPPKSRGRAWRTMRRALELPDQYIPKTIRHTVATELRRRGVPAEQISVLLGHRPADLERMTAVYAKYDPHYLVAAVTALQALLMEVNKNAENWSAGHRVVKIGNAPVAVIPVDVVDQRPS
jgi:integrase